MTRSPGRRRGPGSARSRLALLPASLALLLPVLMPVMLAGDGCSGDDPPPSAGVPSGTSWGYPAVVAAQVLQIDEAADAALASVVSRRDVAAGGARLSGPAQRLLTAELAVAVTRRRPPDPATRLAPSTVFVPQAGPWPRWLLEAGTASGRPTPVLRVLRSPVAREPYAVWAELAVLPGATVPAPVDDPAGAPSVGPNGTGLAMSPAQVAIRYADLLNRGRASASAAAFAADDFRAQLGERLAGDRKRIMSTAVATLTSTHAPVAGTGWGVRTADGGALVVVELRQEYRVKVDARGGVVRADPDLAALAGRATFARELVRTATEVLAFTVPAGSGPSGSTTPVRLVAAIKGDVSATGS